MNKNKLSSHDKAILNCVFNPHLPLEATTGDIQDELKDEEENTEEIKDSCRLELEAVKLTEMGNLKDALDVINQALALTPSKPSLYNNRANIYQYMRKFEEAFQDVNKAIELCSEKHQKTLNHAHCQRGILYRRKNMVEEARQDFEFSSRLGDSFAKSQLVESNPYAALCNQMLRQVMEKLN